MLTFKTRVELEYMPVDSILEYRAQCRLNKNWTECDRIRDYLDSQWIFVFDTKECQEVYYYSRVVRDTGFNPGLRLKDNKDPLWYDYGKYSTYINRKMVEIDIKRGIAADKLFDAWLYSNSSHGI